MSITILRLLAVTSLVVTSVINLTMAQQLPDGPGKTVLRKSCGVCHEPENVVGQAKTREGWRRLIDEMVVLGAKVTDEELKVILNYLANGFPEVATEKTININRAAAKDLQIVLTLSAEDAERIVSYREKNGSFKSVEEVKKVPGVDSPKLEGKKERIVFLERL